MTIPQPMNRTISQQQADEIVNLLGYSEIVNDSETFEAEREFRYFLLHVEAVLIIGFDGSAKIVDFDGELLSRAAFVDFEEVGENVIRYWNGNLDCGRYEF